MDTYFSVINEHLTSLNANEAVARFRELLWADALRLGVSLTDIQVSDLVNVSDGGIDAFVSATNLSQTIVFNGALKRGRTGYQIKTGGSFEPWTASDIKKELFGRKKPSKENLAEGVRNCLGADGTYILVTFGHNLVDKHHREALKHIRSYLKDCGYETPKVEVWSQNNLLGLFHLFPSLALRVSRRDNGPFQSHHSWSLNDDMLKEFQAGEQQNDFMSSLQAGLREPGRNVHIRVLGEPGIGKTKLVLEATRVEDLQPQVLYCRTPSAFLDNPLMSSILADDNQYSAILIIDECDPLSAGGLWNRLKNRGSRIKLITIYNDFDDNKHDIELDAPPLGNEELTKIIESYNIPNDVAFGYVGFCSGSPRVAHVFGENLQQNSDDLLRPTGTLPNLWDRYIAGRDQLESAEFRDRKRVLQYLALFKRFGFASSFAEDARIIAALIEENLPGISWGRYQEIIKVLRSRKILQGENILYITPKALHIRLWLEWWDTYGTEFDLDEFSTRLTPRLKDWLQDMFRYAHGSQPAQRVVKMLLGPNGPFRQDQLLKQDSGAQFFRSLAEADPDSAIICLKLFVQRNSQEELVRFTTGRRDIIRALEQIAMWEHLFADAARVLLKLATAENETWSNNASGVFAELFTPGYGPVASTAAPPPARFPVLIEAFHSGSREQQLLAIKAINYALETQHFHKAIGTEHQGLRRGPQLWMPETYAELFATHRQAWQILRDHLDMLVDDQVRRAAAQVFLNRARGIEQLPEFSGVVIDTLSSLAREPWIGKKDVLSAVVKLLHWKKADMPVEQRKQWEELRDELTGSDFRSLLQRYVGMNLPEDYYDNEGNSARSTRDEIGKLAQQAIENPNLLLPELSWLMTANILNSQSFGYDVGIRDLNYSLLPLLVEEQRSAGKGGTPYLLGGYLAALFERNNRRWEKALDLICRDPMLRDWVPELTARSGASRRAALRIIRLLRNGTFDTRLLLALHYWRGLRDLPEEVFQQLVALLLSSKQEHSDSVALNLYHSYYRVDESKHDTPELPEEPTLTLLKRSLVWDERGTGSLHSNDPYNWTNLATRYLKSYPQHAPVLAEVMLVSLGQDEGISSLDSQPIGVLTNILLTHPKDVWRLISKYLAEPYSTRRFIIQEWLRGGISWDDEPRALLGAIPAQQLWEWADADIEERAWVLASLAPKKLFREEGMVCLAREILVRYGEREDVRENLAVNFMSGGWTGPASLHWARKRERLLEFRVGEENEQVRFWIDEFVNHLDTKIENARVREEYERLA